MQQCKELGTPALGVGLGKVAHPRLPGRGHSVVGEGIHDGSTLNIGSNNYCVLAEI